METLKRQIATFSEDVVIENMIATKKKFGGFKKKDMEEDLYRYWLGEWGPDWNKAARAIDQGQLFMNPLSGVFLHGLWVVVQTPQERGNIFRQATLMREWFFKVNRTNGMIGRLYISKKGGEYQDGRWTVKTPDIVLPTSMSLGEKRYSLLYPSNLVVQYVNAITLEKGERHIGNHFQIWKPEVNEQMASVQVEELVQHGLNASLVKKVRLLQKAIS